MLLHIPRSTSTTRLTRLARQHFLADIGHWKHDCYLINKPFNNTWSDCNCVGIVAKCNYQSPVAVSSGVNSPSLYIPNGHPLRDNGIITPNNMAPPSPTNELPGVPLNLASYSTLILTRNMFVRLQVGQSIWPCSPPTSPSTFMRISMRLRRSY